MRTEAAESPNLGKGKTMELCCHTMQAIGLTCHHEQQRGPDTFTAEEVRKYITGTHNN